MEKQRPSGQALDLDIVPLWMKIFFGAFLSLLAIGEIWKHGLRNWDWLTPVILLGGIAFPAGVTEPLGKNLRWLSRFVFVIWVIACCASAVHFWGWVPGLALAGIMLLSPIQEKWVNWKAYLQKPQGILGALLALILIISFARSTGAWVTTAYAVLSFLLLEGDTTARRSLRDNLRRRSFVVLAAIVIFAAIWASLHPSFGNVAGLVIVVVLVSCDVYLHTEEAPSIPNISQSRS